MSAYYRGEPDFEVDRLDQFGHAYLNESSDQRWEMESQLYQPQEVSPQAVEPIPVFWFAVGAYFWYLLWKEGKK